MRKFLKKHWCFDWIGNTYADLLLLSKEPFRALTASHLSLTALTKKGVLTLDTLPSRNLFTVANHALINLIHKT